MHGLTTGEQYMFRVKAVNAVGTSENSQESDVIKVQAALSEYLPPAARPHARLSVHFDFCVDGRVMPAVTLSEEKAQG